MQTNSWERRRRRRRPAGVAALGAAMLLVTITAVVAIGYATGSTATTQTRGDVSLPAVSAATLNTPHGPRRMRGELPVGFSDDQGGALSFVATAGQALIDFVQSRRTTSVATWTAVYTTGRLSNLSLQKIYDWNPETTNVTPAYRPTGFGSTPGPGVIDIAPVGYQLLAFTAASAHLVVWLHGLGWPPGAAQPDLVLDDALDVQLVWRDGDWKITSIIQPPGTHWDGPTYGEPDAGGYAPWPGGQFTFVTG